MHALLEAGTWIAEGLRIVRDLVAHERWVGRGVNRRRGGVEVGLRYLEIGDCAGAVASRRRIWSVDLALPGLAWCVR
jgi:hypothetical protein